MKRDLKWYGELIKKNTITQILLSWVIGTLGVLLVHNIKGKSIIADGMLIIGVGYFCLIILIWIIYGIIWSINYLIQRIKR